MEGPTHDPGHVHKAQTTAEPEAEVDAAALRVIKDHFPRFRRTASTAVVRNGPCQTVYGCLCGSEHTTSTDWGGREALHVRQWRAAHRTCVREIAKRLLAGDPARFDRATYYAIPYVRFLDGGRYVEND